MELVLEYLHDVYVLSRFKFTVNILLMLALGTLEGIGVLMIIPLLYVAGIIPGMQAGGNLPFGLNSYLASLSGMMTLPVVLILYVTLNFGQSWLQRYQSMLSFDVMQAFSVSMSERLFGAVVYADWQTLVVRSNASVSNVIISEMMRVFSGVNGILQIIVSVLITLVQVFIALLIAPVLTLVVLGGAFTMFMVLQPLSREFRKAGQEISEVGSRLFSAFNEQMEGIKEVKSHGVEAAQVKKFMETRIRLRNNLRRFILLQSRTSLFYQVGSAVFISLFIFAALKIFRLSPRDFIVVAVISSRLWPKISSIQQGLQNIHSVLPAFYNVHELEQACLAAREDLPEAQDLAPAILRQGIEFRNVSFYYQEKRADYALSNININILAGTTTAFVGSSGSGKSTMVDLIIGLLRPQKGEILADGTPLSGQLRQWRCSIGYVPQDAFLTNGTVRENLLWLCPVATENQMWEALHLASIDTFVRSLPSGLNSTIGDRGIMLSGGERQRIVLARALLRHPTVLILDEATSSLDTENEKHIQQAVDSLQGKMTIIIVAHRISTIRNADQIVVLDQGKIVEQGTYHQLMQNPSGRFYSLTMTPEQLEATAI